MSLQVSHHASKGAQFFNQHFALHKVAAAMHPSQIIRQRASAARSGNNVIEIKIVRLLRANTTAIEVTAKAASADVTSIRQADSIAQNLPMNSRTITPPEIGGNAYPSVGLGVIPHKSITFVVRALLAIRQGIFTPVGACNKIEVARLHNSEATRALP